MIRRPITSNRQESFGEAVVSSNGRWTKIRRCNFIPRQRRANGERIAVRLEDAGLAVFFFPHDQEELAGTNGLESMREPFLDARVVVVFFRAPWGQTPWTRVEDTAIGERSLKRGWTSLMFVQLDQTSPFPKWLPDTHVRFNFDVYGADQLVGAIKARVQDQGGVIEPPNAMTEAKRIGREAAYLAKRERLMTDSRWIQDVVHQSLRETMVQIVKLADEVNAEHGFQIKAGSQDRNCVLRSEWVSMMVVWRQPIFGRVTDIDPDHKCYLQVTEFSGAVLLPGESAFVRYRPRELKGHRFQVDVSQSGTLAWTELGKQERIAPSQLAERVMRLFLDLISRANRGEIKRPDL